MKHLLVLPVLIATLVFGACQNEAKTSNQTSATEPSEVTTAQVKEDQTPAKVTIIKYSDYQCPACAYYVPFEKNLKEEYGDDVKIITKHFPLSMHPYAHVAARSVEAARKQGKYKEMHDKIFEGQPIWSRGNAESIFVGYADEIGLNVEQFRQDMNSAEMNRIVMADRREGRELNINSTPTFFINGDRVESNPSTYEGFKALVTPYLD